MPLIGRLSTMSLTDLLQWLGSARKTGTLQIEHEKIAKVLFFREGRVVGCSSDDPPARLGHFLLARGKVTENQVRCALQLQEMNKKHLGRILIEMGAIAEDELAGHLAAKSEEAIYGIFDWDDAVFRFQEGEAEHENLMPVSLRVEDILLRGMKRFDEVAVIREVIPDDQVILCRTHVEPPAELLENRTAGRILQAIDGERTVAEVILLSHGTGYHVKKFLVELHRKGFVATIGRRAERDEPSPDDAGGSPAMPLDLDGGIDLLQGTTISEPAVATATHQAHDSVDAAMDHARELLATSRYEEALDVLDRLYAEHPQNDSLRRLAAEAEAAFVEKAYRHYLPEDKFPVLADPLEELEAGSFSPTEFFLLSRIDGHWAVKSIVQITPSREVETLRTLKRLREAGVIDLLDEPPVA